MLAQLHNSDVRSTVLVVAWTECALITSSTWSSTVLDDLWIRTLQQCMIMGVYHAEEIRVAKDLDPGMRLKQEPG